LLSGDFFTSFLLSQSFYEVSLVLLPKDLTEKRAMPMLADLSAFRSSGGSVHYGSMPM
jgi:hypothetical protein